MTSITAAIVDTKKRAVRVETEDDKGNKSYVVLSADFCHYCKDELADEFMKFMQAKGYDLRKG